MRSVTVSPCFRLKASIMPQDLRLRRGVVAEHAGNAGYDEVVGVAVFLAQRQVLLHVAVQRVPLAHRDAVDVGDHGRRGADVVFPQQAAHGVQPTAEHAAVDKVAEIQVGGGKAEAHFPEGVGADVVDEPDAFARQAERRKAPLQRFAQVYAVQGVVFVEVPHPADAVFVVERAGECEVYAADRPPAGKVGRRKGDRGKMREQRVRRAAGVGREVLHRREQPPACAHRRGLDLRAAHIHADDRFLLCHAFFPPAFIGGSRSGSCCFLPGNSFPRTPPGSSKPSARTT